MKKLLAAFLILMLLIPAAIAEPEEFRLRDGITWSSTPDEVEAIVGEVSFSGEAGDCLVQVYSNIPFGNCSGDFHAWFVGHYNQLILMTYDLVDFPADQTLEEAAADLKAGLDSKYTPITYEPSTLVKLLNGYSRLRRLDEDHIYSEDELPREFSRWIAPDGTEIYMGYIGESYWQILYFNISGIEDLLALMDTPNTNGL